MTSGMFTLKVNGFLLLLLDLNLLFRHHLFTPEKPMIFRPNLMKACS